MKKLTDEQRKEFDLLESNYYVPKSQVKRSQIKIKINVEKIFSAIK